MESHSAISYYSVSLLSSDPHLRISPTGSKNPAILPTNYVFVASRLIFKISATSLKCLDKGYLAVDPSCRLIRILLLDNYDFNHGSANSSRALLLSSGLHLSMFLRNSKNSALSLPCRLFPACSRLVVGISVRPFHCPKEGVSIIQVVDRRRSAHRFPRNIAKPSLSCIAPVGL